MATVAAQTNAVSKSTGGVANVSAKDVDALATSLSQLSGVDDEAIASAENLILTFKRVRNTTGEGNRIFDRATLAALDLSKAAGGAFGDLPTTAKQLAKALNDPVQGHDRAGQGGRHVLDVTEGSHQGPGRDGRHPRCPEDHPEGGRVSGRGFGEGVRADPAGAVVEASRVVPQHLRGDHRGVGSTA